MPGQGVLFALSAEDEARLLGFAEARARIAWAANELEERWEVAWLHQIDTLWFPVHFCLHGSAGFPHPGSPPEAKVIFGGHPLGVSNIYSIDYKDRELVRKIASALAKMRDDAVWARASLVERKDYDGPKDDTIQLSIVEAVHDLEQFYRRALEAERAVIFTVDM